MFVHVQLGRKILAMFIVAAFAVFLAATQSAIANVQVGVAAAVLPQARAGTISNTMAQTLKTIIVGAPIDSEMLIETGQSGRTQVLFVDGSSMNIGPASRIIIDRFVFNPDQLKGELSANIKEGSLRFIGGVLSKTANQVRFNAGDATIGIRGGIAKIGRDAGGQVRAELVYGRLRMETPEGVYQTARIGTVIAYKPENTPDSTSAGKVTTSSVTAQSVKKELDAEARESFLAPKAQQTEVPEIAQQTEVPEAQQTEVPEMLAEEVPEAQQAEVPEIAQANNVADNQRTYISDAPAIQLLLDAALFDDETTTATPATRQIVAPNQQPDFARRADTALLMPIDEAARQVQADAQEDTKETSISVSAFYNLHLAGQRLPTRPTLWGDGAAAYWLAYNTSSDKSYMVLQSDGSVVANFDTSSLANNATNNVIFDSTIPIGIIPIGRVRNANLLGEYRFSFAAPLTTQTGENGNVVTATASSPRHIVQWHRAADLPDLGRDIVVQNYDMLATGLWTVESFTDRALANITYQHQAHFAIGAPLSASTIRALAGMAASFSGHAYGTLITANTNRIEGLGNVDVRVDFANPKDARRNSWVLSNFVAGAVRVPTTSIGLVLDTETARYSGSDTSAGAQIDGALYGTFSSRGHNLQTGGTFSINTENYALSGSFAAHYNAPNTR